MDSLDEDLISNNRFLFKQFRNGITHILVLWIISKEKIHGYGIVKKLNEFIEIAPHSKIKKFNPSKIYPILNKMEEKGLVTSEAHSDDNKNIKYYEITKKGKKVIDIGRFRTHKLFLSPVWREFIWDMAGVEFTIKEEDDEICD